MKITGEMAKNRILIRHNSTKGIALLKHGMELICGGGLDDDRNAIEMTMKNEKAATAVYAKLQEVGLI